MELGDLAEQIYQRISNRVFGEISFDAGNVSISLRLDPLLLGVGDDPFATAHNIATVVTSSLNSPTFLLHSLGSPLRDLQVSFIFRPSESSFGEVGFGPEPNPLLGPDQGIMRINFWDMNKEYRIAGTIDDWYAFNLQHIWNHEFLHVLTGEPDGPWHLFLVDRLNAETDAGPPRATYGDVRLAAHPVFTFCFLPHTPIILADGTTRPIAAIRPGDMVLSPDKTGTLVPARVTRTFVNDVAHVPDFHGTGVTPGHVFLCGAGRFRGRHVPLIDILRDDGAVVRQDGSLMRASTGCCVVGSEADASVKSSALRGAGTMVPREYREVRKTIVSICLPVAGNVWTENNAVV